MRKIGFLLLLLPFIGFAQPDSLAIQRDSSLLSSRANILIDGDSIFTLYDNYKGYSASDRAGLASIHLAEIMAEKEFYPDSFKVILEREGVYRIAYRKKLVNFITDQDAAWYAASLPDLAEEYRSLISRKCNAYVSGADLKNLLIQIGLAILVILVSGFVIRFVNRFFKFLSLRSRRLQGSWVRSIEFRNYEFISEARLMQILLVVLNVTRILFLIFLLYLTLPILFSIFPWTEGIANKLIDYIVSPISRVFRGVVGYIPNLFTILVIFFAIRYLTKGVKFLAREIDEGKLTLNNFHPDWAIPTARIVNFLLYAFMLVLIWPYLPGSDSAVFQGVSVFLGLLISLGSSSAISNIVAGLVITYMRPYKIGDRVKIADTSGDIIEKNLLVTRVRTIKNEMITVPNSQVLATATINYSESSDRSDGLIIHSTVTIGYDVPWRKVHKVLIDAACCTPFIEENPKPFVLQTSLDDFYVSYQVNAYTNQPAKQAVIYSDLHALIQDKFAKAGIEIMSPHYRAHRDGPDTTPVEKVESKKEE
jgi:small-conductance mechanosensitive channel